MTILKELIQLDDHGNCLFRNYFSIKVMLDGAVSKRAVKAQRLFEDFLTIVPEESLEYFVPSPNSDLVSPKKASKTTKKLLLKKFTSQKDVFVWWFGPQNIGPDFSFSCSLSQKEDLTLDCIQIDIPVSLFSQLGNDYFVDWMKNIAQMDVYLAAAGITLYSGDDRTGSESDIDCYAAEGLRANILLEHEFYQVYSSYMFAKRFSPYWLNVYGKKALKLFGGTESFAEIPHTPFESSLMTILHESPEGGRKNYELSAALIGEKTLLHATDYGENPFSVTPDGNYRKKGKEVHKLWATRFLRTLSA